MCVCVRARVRACAACVAVLIEAIEGVASIEVELQGFVWLLTWVLGTNFLPSQRTVST